LDGGLEPVQPVVQSPKILLGDDGLPVRDHQRVGPPTGLVVPLPVGLATEPPWPPRSAQLG
jgi:hypothetical protein